MEFKASVRVWQVVIGRKPIDSPTDNPMGRKELLATKRHFNTTTARVGRPLAYCILGLVCAVIAGCTPEGQKSGQSLHSQSEMSAGAAPPPQVPVAATNEPIRRQAAAELGPDVAAEIPASTRPATKPVDAGAKKLVDSIGGSLSSLNAGGEVVQISLSALRNQSRSTAAEFAGMLDRLAGLLNDAAEGSRIRFSAVEGEVAPYEMQGTVYLATRDGFDLWEMYLSISSTARPYTLWQNNGPVWLIRQARPGQPQVLMER